MKRKVRKFAGDEGSVVRTRSDKEFEEDSKYGGYGRYMPKTKEYTVDEAKEKLFGLFGGKKEDTSKFDELESVKKTKTLSEQIGRKAEPKADAGETSGKLPGNKTDRMSVVKEEDAPSKVEKAEPPKTSGGGGSSNKSSVAKTSSGTSKAAENKYKPNEERKSKPYPKDARPLKPVSKAEEDAEGERGKRMEEEAAAQLKKNKSVVLKQKDDDSTDKIIDKTVKDTSGAKTVYSDKPFSFTKNLQDKKDKEKKSSSADDRYKTYKETNAKYQKMLDSYKNKKDDDSKVSAADKSVKSFKNPAREVPEDKGAKKAINKAKSGSTVGRMPGSKMDSDSYSMTLGGDLDPKGMMRKNSSRNRMSGDNDMKKGGQVKKYAKGGSASSRADGIAARGKTRGRIC